MTSTREPSDRGETDSSRSIGSMQSVAESPVSRTGERHQRGELTADPRTAQSSITSTAAPGTDRFELRKTPGSLLHARFRSVPGGS